MGCRRDVLSSRDTVIASEAKQSVETISLEKVCVAGRPQPTLCKHGGQAEPAAQTFEWVLEIASLRSQ
jgi:hypothetical protein